MAIDITGTNTEKIDKLAAAVIELRATSRIGAFAQVLLVPIMAGGIGYLVSQNGTTATRLAGLDERSAQVEKRLDRIETKIDKLSEKK
jgi:hypothetical protein